ncbi:right-handed parallel beta-helix repeat-containing protein [Akkermansiaceae bacterium]|nr:right-handed parallel beta-helix repeat-containing protein [Akkermansiaceae bacterium]MDB4286452.1 right-handed parallel beta-helix repeat-containing protein [bacterium]MDC0274916.1 right-handed parallel beta-helix repeat-containing protein [Akkermansiaceae bacterium]
MTDSPHPMTRSEARKRIGLGERDRVADYLPKWLEAEERLVLLVIQTSDLDQRAKYESDLVSLREVIQTLTDTPERKRPAYGMWIWAIVVLGLLVAGLTGYKNWAVHGSVDQIEVSLDEQKTEFEQALEKRRWDEAEESISSLEASGVGKDWLAEAEGKISEGKAEEKGQQVGFLIGNAQAALEAGRLTEARDFCDQVDELEPDHPKLVELRSLIDEGELQVKSLLVIKAIRKSISGGKLELAEKNLTDLVKIHPGHGEIPVLRQRLGEVRKRLEKDQAAARELLAKARELDEGIYSAEALGFLEEAMRLDPNEEVRNLYQKMSGYGRVIRVPSEYKTIAEAIKAARDLDRILISRGTYQESLIVPPGIELVGESRKSTVLEFEGAEGSVITLNKPGKKVRLASLTLRHKGLANDNERFPVVAVSRGNLQLEDAAITGASGHGLAIIDGGSAELAQCEITKSGWDGVAVRGEGSTVSLNNVGSRENLHHGVDFWDGATGKITSSQMTKNGRSGVAILSPGSKFEITTSRVESNREVGLFISNAPSALVDDCEIHSNQLGGIAIQNESLLTTLSNNKITKNGEAGVVIEKGVQLSSYDSNVVEDNTGKQLWKDAVFPEISEQEVDAPPVPAPPLLEEE